MISEAEIDRLLRDLDSLTERPKTSDGVVEYNDAEIAQELKSLDALDNIVVPDIDPSDLASVSRKLVVELERALATAKEYGDPIVTRIIQSALARAAKP